MIRLDEHEAQISVRTVKDQVAMAVDNLHPRSIELYIAGPSALAVALGHRWNALPPTQLNEFDASTGNYTPTVRIA